MSTVTPSILSSQTNAFEAANLSTLSVATTDAAASSVSAATTSAVQTATKREKQLQARVYGLRRARAQMNQLDVVVSFHKGELMVHGVYDQSETGKSEKTACLRQLQEDEQRHPAQTWRCVDNHAINVTVW
jgi:hypothetical protein